MSQSKLATVAINFFAIFLLISVVEAGSAIALRVRPYVGALLEGSLQIDRRVLSPVYRDRNIAEAIFSDLASIKTSYQSYSVWSLNEMHTKSINIDANGIRRTCFNKPEGGLKIYMFGGSTLFGTGVEDCETIPSLLAREISTKHPNLKFEVINFGVTGYQSTQEIARLLRELQSGRRPDWVLFYDGVNDVYAGAYSPGIPGEHQNLDVIAAKFNSTAVAMIKGSNTFELISYFVERSRNRHHSPSTPASRGVAEAYDANMAVLRGISREFNFQHMAFLQPVLLEGSKPPSLFERDVVERAGNLGAAYKLNYPQLRKLNVHDISSVFEAVREDLYIDFCHLGAKGNEIVAREILKSLKL